jgi:hypothetical protein
MPPRTVRRNELRAFSAPFAVLQKVDVLPRLLIAEAAEKPQLEVEVRKGTTSVVPQAI